MSEGAPVYRVENYVRYLRVLAESLRGPRYQSRLDPSDIVQQACVEACASLPSFTGTCLEEFKAWLRRILTTTAVDMSRFHDAGRRNVKLERAIGTAIDESSRRLVLMADDPSPSSKLRREESLLTLADAIDRLPALQREAVSLTRIEGLSLKETAARMDRTVPAVAGYLRLGMKSLRRFLEPENPRG